MELKTLSEETPENGQEIILLVNNNFEFAVYIDGRLKKRDWLGYWSRGNNFWAPLPDIP